MHRPIIFLALVSLWLVSAYERDGSALLQAQIRAIRSNRRPSNNRQENNGHSYTHGHNGGPSDNQGIASKLCANTSLAESFIVQTQALITIISNNNSYAAVTNKHANEFAFIQDPANQAIIVSNCTGFFSGLNAARALDTAAVQQVELFTRDAETQLSNIVTTLLGSTRGNHDRHRGPKH